MLGARSPATPTLNSASIHTCPTDSCLYYTPYSVLFPVIPSHQSCLRGCHPTPSFLSVNSHTSPTHFCLYHPLILSVFSLGYSLPCLHSHTRHDTPSPSA